MSRLSAIGSVGTTIAVGQRELEHGRAAEVGPARLEELRGLYLGKHPYLNDFVRAPSCALLSVAIETYDLVVNFQEVHVLRVGDGLSTAD